MSTLLCLAYLALAECCSNYAMLLRDTIGDGWSGNHYHITDQFGREAGSGTLEFQETTKEETLCLQDGCYTISIDGNPYGGPDQISWSLETFDAPYATVEGDAASKTDIWLHDGTLAPGSCSRPPTTSEAPTKSPSATTSPTVTPAPSGKYCYRIDLLSPLSTGWLLNRLTISSEHTKYVLTLAGGSHQSEIVCLEDGCYVFVFGGGSTIGSAVFAYVFDHKFTGFAPSRLEFGLSGGRIQMGLCTVAPSMTMSPTNSPGPVPHPSVSPKPTETFTPTESPKPTPNMCLPSCYDNSCNDLSAYYTDGRCEDFEAIGCDCSYCRCRTDHPTILPSVSLYPTITTHPTLMPSLTPSSLPSLSPTATKLTSSQPKDSFKRVHAYSAGACILFICSLICLKARMRKNDHAVRLASKSTAANLPASKLEPASDEASNFVTNSVASQVFKETADHNQSDDADFVELIYI